MILFHNVKITATVNLAYSLFKKAAFAAQKKPLKNERLFCSTLLHRESD